MSTVSNIPEPQSAVPPIDSIPKLRAGDRLTAAEFHGRYEAMPDVKKAELIDGVVYMPPALKIDHHGEPSSGLVGWLVTYKAYTPGVQVGDNSTVFLDAINELQPDALLRIRPSHGGQSKTTDGYVDGAPELAAEISSSSKRYDRKEKFEVYRGHGVREYLIWLVEEREIRWYVLEDNEYKLLTTSDGILRSNVFPGLWLDPAALLADNMARVLEVLQQGIATDAHRDFCQKLQAAGSSK